MTNQRTPLARLLSRRRVLGLIGLTAAGAVATACGAEPTPTSAPAKPAAPATAAPAKPAAPAPTTAPSGQPATAKPGATSAYKGQPLVTGPFEGEARKLTGAGATFPAVLYTKWFSEYNKLTGIEVNYQSIGSGGGIKSISDQTVDFGATDGPMTDEQLKAAKGGNIFHIPTALGAVVPTYNLPGITQAIKLTPETLAGIFLGQIKKWDDAKLKADNPGVDLPSSNIVVVHRSDGSGTTYIFVDYLSNVSPEWKSKVGTATSVKWPTGLGAKGNEGVAGEVKQTPNAIGYVELIYAEQNKLQVAEVKNQAGTFIKPSVPSVTAAAEGVASTIAPDLRASIVNAPGDVSYPISGFTWILAYENLEKKPAAIAISRLLWWCTHEAQKFNAELGYAPLPDGIVAKAEEKILGLTAGGEKVFPHSVRS